MKSQCLILILLSLSLTLFSISKVFGSETRTIELFPQADAYVTCTDKDTNFGKELNLLTNSKETHVCISGRSFTAGTSQIVWFPIHSLYKGSEISGSFVVTSGGNKDVDFLISTYHKNLVYLSRVTSHSFFFVSPETDTYSLGFDNTFSWITSKGISLSDVYRTDYNIYASPILMSFDLSSIPPEATILSAKLRLYVSDFSDNSTLDTYFSSDNNWIETEINYANALLDAAKSEPTTQVFVNRTNHWYEFDVKPDVVRAIPQGRLTEIIAVSDGGSVEIASRESENKPKLEISYTYVSTSSSVSSNIMIESQNVAVDVNTDPSQTVGNIRIQYSPDQLKWTDMATLSGGSANYVWTPQVTGQIYVRSLWETSWNGGSYYTTSSVNSLYIIPLYLIVLPVIVMLGAVIGIYFWRRRKKRQPD